MKLIPPHVLGIMLGDFFRSEQRLEDIFGKVLIEDSRDLPEGYFPMPCTPGDLSNILTRLSYYGPN